MVKFVYDFEEGSNEMKPLLGGKGANLAEMSLVGLPVPEGFTITTEANFEFFDKGGSIPEEMLSQIKSAVCRLEEKADRRFNDIEKPLLVSVRSGAPVSMPGMMDTVLNLGINRTIAEAIGKKTGNFAFAYDSYRRFIQMYSDVVMGVDKSKFDMVLDDVLNKKSASNFKELDSDTMMHVIDDFLEVYSISTGEDFPEDAETQLINAVKAVFNSWNNERAILYRSHNGISHDIGTAVNVQRMVFGNYDENSATGVLFTRNPVNGKDELFGECLFNAQGEDVVAGIRTPIEISELKTTRPELFDELYNLSKKLEKHYKEVQDIEFTMEQGKVYLLQTRTAKRTAKSAIKIAMDFVEEGVIDEKEALIRIPTESISMLLHPDFDEKAKKKGFVLAKGLPASPGAACGRVYFTADDVLKAKEKGENCILVRKETSPEDLAGMIGAGGILTSRGGMTSHAAVVARSMGKTCVSGCQEIVVSEAERCFETKTEKVHEGDYISIDGYTGKIYKGALEFSSSIKSDELDKILEWSDMYSDTKVRANADTPADARVALSFGADGIGLCRTEHMFFDRDRITAVREMILSQNLSERKRALDKLKPYQIDDFYEIIKTLKDRPITIRLLDPPLHEFLPKSKEDVEELASKMNKPESVIRAIISKLSEFNPMLGHRGCRLGITYPEIYVMQVEAIIEAAIRLEKEGQKTKVEIMIPLVGFDNELKMLRKMVEVTAGEVMTREKHHLDYKIGTMIEVPRAALTADEVAKHADFFSFGTNDLTQMTLGFSRDDVNSFMNEYIKKGVFELNPFVSIDTVGVGKLVEIAAEKARQSGKKIKLGVCGEHGGDPKSIEFFLSQGLEYVSCSPYRIPIAKLASAKYRIMKGRG